MNRRYKMDAKDRIVKASKLLAIEASYINISEQQITYDPDSIEHIVGMLQEAIREIREDS